MHDEFTARIERLKALVKGDSQHNRDAILAEMEGFAHQHQALRFFLSNAIATERYRRLTSAHSFYICGNEYFRMRINAWYPQAGQTGEIKERLESPFTIDRCHNHSFDFFTVGVFGPGYTTQFKETSQYLEKIGVGDEIIFDHVWEDQLKMAKALFVPKSTIFHTQFCP